MKTLYALIAVCLSVPALAYEPEPFDYASNIYCPEYGATVPLEQTATVPAIKSFDDYSFDPSVDYDGNTAATPATKPLEDFSFDPSIDYDDYTAIVPGPESKPAEKPADTTVDVFADDDAWDFKVPVEIDHSIQASDWW
jgi:hypothetical protein